jgi:hypothetical protein
VRPVGEPPAPSLTTRLRHKEKASGARSTGRPWERHGLWSQDVGAILETMGATQKRHGVAFLAGGVIGTLGGLIGLGGAEFRLPLLITLFASALRPSS